MVREEREREREREAHFIISKGFRMPAWHAIREPCKQGEREHRKKSLVQNKMENGHTLPALITRALGGVATGSMKASDTPNAVGTINSSGFCPRATASEPTTGSRMLAVATLLRRGMEE